MNDPGKGLDFEKADFGSAANNEAGKGATCAICQTAIDKTYFTANGAVVCERCKEQLAQRPQGFEAQSFVKGALFGSGVAALGSVVWYAIARFTGYEFGLLAIVIGVFVGKAVQKGAGFRSGVAYQLLAVGLTYVSIVAAYAPAAIAGSGEDVSILAVIIVCLAAPFLAGSSNIIGILIIGFGIYEAWKYSKVAPIELAGPHNL